jgi:sugar/nucleoside kinase (ribokinase family)
MSLLHFPAGSHRFRGMAGTGGIGYGSFFLVEGNETLGREESRAGHFLDRRDYCKLHIICHYVKALLGEGFDVSPIGRVGRDADGARLTAEMAAAGLDTRFVQAVDAVPTLFSFCYLYPDGSGGNLTTRDSASGTVDAAAIRAAEPLVESLGSAGIALAVPEVPLGARRALLELGAQHGLFTAASFTRAEMDEVRSSGVLEMVNLCALNLEEAAAAAGIAHGRAHAGETAQRAAEGLSRSFPRMLLSITAGKNGSWSWDGSDLVFDPAAALRVEGTSGAGDAHLAGVLAGLSANLALAEAQQVGTITAGASVTSPHTIHPALTAELLHATCAVRPATSPRVLRVLALLDTSNDGP